MDDEKLHHKYLPFDRATMLRHFATVGTDTRSADKKLEYYTEKLKILSDWEAGLLPGATSKERAKSKRQGMQIEKNERFWIVTALLSVFYDGQDRSKLTDILRSCLGEDPPIDGISEWGEALGSEQFLYFEVSLPTPASFQPVAARRIDERVIITNKRETAKELSNKGRNLEGKSVIDALLISPETGFSVLFEGKVTSDISYVTTYDETRNQIARNVDIMLDEHAERRLDKVLRARRADRSCFVLITPELFKVNYTTRLYGWLMEDYKKPESLLRDLPHRSLDKLTSASSRMGWLTWQEIENIAPGACKWL